MYIVFEGIVGSGKTTQSKNLFEYLKKKYPEKTVIYTFEPGGSEIANAIRKVVQGTDFKEKMDPVCEAYLYASSRAHTLRNIVKPVLDQDGIVVSDRSFITSLAFQSFGRELGIDNVLKINDFAIKNFIPDLVLYFDLDIEQGLRRVKKDGEERASDDKFESEDIDFFKKIESGYLKVSKLPMFDNKWVNIDASGSREDVFNRVIKLLESYL